MDIIEVIEGGLFTTVQDLGRHRYQRYGVPVSGAMDQFALRVANLLVGNQEGEAGMEITLVGAQLRFLADTVVAITGADLGPHLDGQPLPTWQPIAVAEGGVLSFAEARDGMRAYLALAGGIDVPVVLDSRSTYIRSRLGGLEGRILAQGDLLSTSWEEPAARVEGRRMPSEHIPTYGHGHALRVVMGPQEDAFTQEGIQTFLSSTYTVTPLIDRIGYRLEGPHIQHIGGADIISDGTPFGAIQVTGDHMPIVLLADRGTTGGYTKIANVISVDIPRLAQAAPGDTVTFHSVGLEEAHQALREQEKVLQQIGRAPATVFARRRYQARVDGVEHQVATSLMEMAPDTAEQPGPPMRRTLRVTGDGETHTFDVELEDTDNP